MIQFQFATVSVTIVVKSSRQHLVEKRELAGADPAVMQDLVESWSFWRINWQTFLDEIFCIYGQTERNTLRLEETAQIVKINTAR